MDEGTGGSKKPWKSHNIRERLMAAARDLFAERGYQVTTVEIAKRAGVSEPTLFRHFGSKASLFEATVVEPFAAFVQHWATDIPRYPADMPIEVITKEYVTTLLTFARENRALLHVLVAARAGQDSDLVAGAGRVKKMIADNLTMLEQRTAPVAEQRGATDVDFAVAIPAELAMLIGLVLLEDWVYPSSRPRPDEARVVAEVCDLLLHGLLHRG